MSLASEQSQPAKADLSNWRASPFNRWAFRNISELLPVAEVAAGSHALPLPTKLQAFDRFSLAAGKDAPLSLADFLRATEKDGFVILHVEQVVYEVYIPGCTDNT